MGEGVRVLERLQRIDAHHLSRGIPALEEIAAEDHSDYNTWMDPNQSDKVGLGYMRRTGGTEHDLYG